MYKLHDRRPREEKVLYARISLGRTGTRNAAIDHYLTSLGRPGTKSIVFTIRAYNGAASHHTVAATNSRDGKVLRYVLGG